MWEIQYKKRLDGKVTSATVERKSKVKPLEYFLRFAFGSDGAAPINALK